MSRFVLLTCSCALTLGMAGCASQPSDKVDFEPFDARKELLAEQSNAQPVQKPKSPVQAPAALTSDLLALQGAPRADKRIDIEVRNRPAKQFFSDLGQSTSLNILVDPEVTGEITLSLRNISLQQLTAALRDLYGFDFQKTSYGYRVVPDQITTQIYQLNYLNVQRAGTTKTNVGGTDQNSVITEFSSSETSEQGFWFDIERSVKGFIRNSSPEDRAVVINRQSGLMVVRATAREHSHIAQFLLDAELIMQKQVIIEAKIIEVTLSREFASGINWSIIEQWSGAEYKLDSSLSGNSLSNMSGIGGVFNFGINVKSFSSVLQLLDQQGDVQVLSSPRVSTLNNQKAVIKVGDEEYFATVTSVSVDDDGVVTPVLEMQQFFSGIALDVTPQIGDDNNVTLHVHPSVSNVVEDTKVISLAGDDYSLPLALSSVRESDSVIRAQSGQIIVIGGLLQKKKNDQSAGLPVFDKVPVLRSLFAQDRQQQVKSELVILLKPTVFDSQSAQQAFDDVIERLN